MIQNTIGSILNHEYLEFVQDFAATYSSVIDDQMMVIAQALIQRIKFETNKPAPESTSAMFIQKSINILKQIT